LSLINERIASGLGGKPQCSDLEDNDGDGKTDYPDDSNCESILDESEGVVDDDGDEEIKGETDFAEGRGSFVFWSVMSIILAIAIVLVVLIILKVKKMRKIKFLR